ncbi:Arabinanase/levansucrase/invertase [Echria macrotheca]|uniref:Arabinanase/levansucrase/invertase n=1 Tax=Echria macrotheca TaxID=438768 RepID=A0AAJ0BC47_9PEZI|nr:Arabinanase/levansucrase/invertase [Echria macrotheca]
MKPLFLSVLPLALGATTFTNPVLWQDYPDVDVFRVNSTYYYSSSTFAYSPGAPVLTSPDLVNWTPVTHSVPTLNFGPRYNLNGSGSAYVKGIWASTLRYRASTDSFIWMGCVESSKTYIWSSPAPRNTSDSNSWKWTSQGTNPACYYDCGLLIDDDDTLYISYGNPRISVAQLSRDGTRQVKTQTVYDPGSGTTFEGSRLYKINGTYYIFATRPADAEYVLKSTTNSPFGPYTAKPLVNRISGPLSSAGFSHQGGVVDTPDGRWYYVAFMDSYPGGRIPVVAPLKWTSDGWPEVVTDSKGAWAREYPLPVPNPSIAAGPGPEGTDLFPGPALGPQWEWNHNPDNSKWKANSGLTLQTADVTTDLFAARNTLTQRILGPKSAGTFRIDASKMRDGDRAGAVLFRDRSAYIGLWKDGSSAKIVLVNNLTLAQSSWTTSSKGSVAATGPTLTATDDVWLRIEADITPAFGSNTERTATFSYSSDGKTFTKLGTASLANSWQYFTGYRFGVFNHATKDLGGEIKVKSFTMQLVK